MNRNSAAAKPRVRLSSGERQEEIVAAVLALARERGPDAITTQAIAERIGVTQGAVFRHFPDKDAIWLAVFAWVRASLLGLFDTALDAKASPLANLERVFHAHVGLVATTPGLPRVLFHELQSAGDSKTRPAVRTMIGDYRKRLAEMFEAAKASGELPRGLDAALATVLFIGAVQGLVIQSALAGEAMPARNAGPMFALLRDGYRGASPPKRMAARRKRVS
jgi:AcrR family transcriptional regulator